MTNQEWLAKQIGELTPEEVYDLLYHIVVVIGSRYNTSRGGIADWLTQDAFAYWRPIKQDMDEVEDDSIHGSDQR